MSPERFVKGESERTCFQWVRFLPKVFPKKSSNLSISQIEEFLMAGKFSIYKYLKLENKGWRYARAAYHPNGKIKPDTVLVKSVNGKNVEGKHPEGFTSLTLITRGLQPIPSKV
jgi:hypothetical protein